MNLGVRRQSAAATALWLRRAMIEGVQWKVRVSQSGVALRLPPHSKVLYAPIMPPEPSLPWPHAPLHRLGLSGTYFVTAGTYLKQQHFCGAARLRVLQRGLLTVCRDFAWHLEAWAVFSNHYHFVAHSPELEEGAQSMSVMLGQLHEKLAKWINKQDGKPGRKIWHNFRETRLTYEKSYLARLKYTHHNAVHHGLVLVANQYPWCSAAWFERTAAPAQVKTIYSFKTDTLNVYDEYAPAPEW